MVNAIGTCLGPASGGGGIREAGDTIAESLVGYHSTRKRAAGRSIG